MSKNESSLEVLRRRIPLFDGFGDGELSAFLDNTQRKTIKAGDLIIGEGTLSTKLFVIVSGKAIVSKAVGTSQEIVATLNPGATVGEMGVVDCAPRSARVMAAEETVVLEMQHEYLESADPVTLGKLFRNISIILARRVREANGVVKRASEELQSADAFAAMLSDVGLDKMSVPNLSARGASFENGDFEDATFRGANMRNADLRGADFEGALFDDDTLIGEGGVGRGLRGLAHSEPDMPADDVRDLARSLSKRKK